MSTNVIDLLEPSIENDYVKQDEHKKNNGPSGMSW